MLAQEKDMCFLTLWSTNVYFAHGAMSMNLMPAGFFHSPKIFLYSKNQVSQVLHCGSCIKAIWGAAVQSHFRTLSHTCCWKQNPQQTESIVSFNYFSRCQYQRFLCKYIFMPWGMLIWDQNYTTLKGKHFLLTSSFSMLSGTCYRIMKVLKLSQSLFFWCSVYGIIEIQYCYSIFNTIQCTFTVCLL